MPHDTIVRQPGDVGGGQNQDDRLSKLPAVAGMTVDVMSTTGATIKATTKITETVVSHALTRPTTLIGAAVAGLPAAYHIYEDLKNGRSVSTNDLITVGISAVAVGLEFSPEGVAVNIASGLVSLGGVAWDAYTMTQPDNQ